MDFRLEGTKASAGREIDASEIKEQKTGEEGEGKEEGKKELEFRGGKQKPDSEAEFKRANPCQQPDRQNRGRGAGEDQGDFKDPEEKIEGCKGEPGQPGCYFGPNGGGLLCLVHLKHGTFKTFPAVREIPLRVSEGPLPRLINLILKSKLLSHKG